MNKRILMLCLVLAIAPAAFADTSASFGDYSGGSALIGSTPLAGPYSSGTISGTWGNAEFPFSSAGTDLYFGGILVAQCFENTECWFGKPDVMAWSHTFTSSELVTLSGLSNADLVAIQTSCCVIRLGDVNVELTSGNPVPEPGTMVLLGSGIAGFIARRRMLNNN